VTGGTGTRGRSSRRATYVSATEPSAVHRRRFLAGAAAGLGVAGTTTALAAGSEGYEPLGSVRVRGAHELVVAGTTGFVAAADGFATVDLADPADPVVLAERRGLLADREGGPLRQVWDVAVDGGRLAVAGPAGGGEPLRAVVVYDVSDPADPTREVVHETDTAVHNCDLADGVAYLTGSSREDYPLVAVDVADGTGTEVGTWSAVDADPAWGEVGSGLRPLHDVVVRDGLAYCANWDAGTFLVDVSDPAAPTAVDRVGEFAPADLAGLDRAERARRRIEPPGNDHFAAPSADGSLLGVGAEAWDVDGGDDTGGPGGIRLYDGDDRERLGTVAPTVPDDATPGNGVTTTAHNFELRGDRLYSSWYRDGVKLFDVSDPSAPSLLAHWRRPADRSFWTAQAVVPGEYFAATSMARRGSVGTVYTFPDAAGEQADQPALAETPTPTASPAPTATPAPTTDTPSPAPTAVPGEDDTPTSGGPGTPTPEAAPGLGPLAAAGGLGLAAWRLLRDGGR